MRRALLLALVALSVSGGIALASWHSVLQISASVTPPPPTCAVQPAIVATTSTPQANDGGTSPAITTTGATAVVLYLGWSHASNASPGISDSKGNTWTALGYAEEGSGFANEFWICYPCTVGAGHTFTLSDNGGASVYGGFIVAAVSNVGYGGLGTDVDAYNSAAGASVANGVTTGSVGPITTQRNCMIGLTGAAIVGTGSGAPTTPTGYTSAATVTTGGVAYSLAYKAQTVAAAFNPTWTGLNSSGFGSDMSVLSLISTNAPAASGYVSGGPCEALTGGCVGAYSCTISMTNTYSGPLCQVYNGTTTRDIVQTANHIADMAALDVAGFCAGGVPSGCVVSRIYSQYSAANDLYASKVNYVPFTDCSTGGLYECAAPLQIDITTGLPKFQAGVNKYMYDVLGVNALTTGYPTGSADRTVVWFGKPLYQQLECCGVSGLETNLANQNDMSSFGVFVSYGHGIYATCIGATSYCAGPNLEWESAPTPSADYSTSLISNAVILTNQWDSTNGLLFSVNGTTLITWAAAAKTPATGQHYRIGGGGDGSQPATADTFGALVTSTSISSGDRAALVQRIKDILPSVTFP